MIRRHAALYLGARGGAALGNMFAVAVFSRLAGPAVYGGYLVMFAAASVLNGFAVQWLRYAFFANYREDDAQALVPTFVLLVAGSLLISIPVAVAVLSAGGSDGSFTLGVLLLATAIGLFDSTCEIFRTRLEVMRVVVASLLRTVLIIALGTAALWYELRPFALALAVASANLIAAAPALLALLPMLGARPNWVSARAFLVFGWPLLLSFGIGAFAQSVDRFALDRFAGASLVGAYGAASDFVRSSFTVIAEALASSLISIAKRQHVSGDVAAARATLAITYKLFLLLGVFGIAFFLVFGDFVFAILFPPAFREATAPLLPVIVASAAMLVFRNLYFGQIIYFTKASHLELISTIILLVTNTSLCLTLIPSYGAAGAAWAFLAGQVLSTVFFIAGGRGRFTMPVLPRPTLAAVLTAAALIGWSRIVAGIHVGTAASLGLDGAAFAMAFGSAACLLGVIPPGALTRLRR